MSAQSSAFEVNFDGLIGPTHHFAGLAYGNVASMTNQGRISNPRAAALQGLRKMRLLHDLGIKQALIPPVQRPHFTFLHNLGFTGTREQVLSKLSRQAPQLISAFFSASSMWTANSATVSPSADTQDRRVHITPANLTSKFHRALEPTGTTTLLRAIFKDPDRFTVHDPLFANAAFGDEGAANHTRLTPEYGAPGLEFFVYGREAFPRTSNVPSPKRFPARQSREASEAIARQHGLSDERTVFWQQDPEAIDAGAFHNDVVSVGNGDLFFYHEDAFLREKALIAELQAKFASLNANQPQLRLVRVSRKDVTLHDAVTSYLFNSQLVSLPSGKTALIAPIESQENESVRSYLKGLVGASGPIHEVKFVDLRESMRNGGGPACLRLRVALASEELASVHSGVFLNESLFTTLETWIQKHYRDRLSSDELCDPVLIREVETALDELTQALKLGSVYPFQRES